MYPLKFKPIYKEIIWGGRSFAGLGRKIPPRKNIAESWELSVHDEGQSIISNGPYKGRYFKRLLEEFGKDITGYGLPDRFVYEFPLLVKLIDANDDLSIQVHPTDDYAGMNEDAGYGKDETWVVLAAAPGAKLVYGLKEDSIDREKLRNAIIRGEAEKYLNYVEAGPGDVFNVYPGLIHGIGKGILIAEFQQNSNITYRIYDYNRVDSDGNKRELHIQKALDVAVLKKIYPFDRIPGNKESNIDGNMIMTYVYKKPYVLQTVETENGFTDDTGNQRFYIYHIISGEGYLEYGNNSEPLKKAETVLIPACIGEFTLKGKMKAVRVYIGTEYDKKIKNAEEIAF